MKSDIIVIGGGASGLMAAYGAASKAVERGVAVQVTVLEKMPRPARKIMITGKGRCNFTNLKAWNEFSGHIRSHPNFVKPAFFNLTPDKTMDFFEDYGMYAVVERGDRVFPESGHASDVVDTLVNACLSLGVRIETECEVSGIGEKGGMFVLTCADGRSHVCARLIVATGGLSYPTTGSTGDGYRWAEESGHAIVPCFPSLTALVPEGYKASPPVSSQGRFHIDRSTPLTEVGRLLCGVQLKNVSATLLVQGIETESGTGDLDFTDGGIEGPIGFQLSRKAVKSLVGGSKVALALDLKPGVPLAELVGRVKALWDGICRDPRSVRLREKERCRVLLGKLMPRELIPGFLACHPEVFTMEHRGRTHVKVWVNTADIAKALKSWKMDLSGYVGYERSVVTAGGVSVSEVLPKTMESRIRKGLYFCGEVLDVDGDTGGYNLQAAFSTGFLAGQSAAVSFDNK